MASNQSILITTTYFLAASLAQANPVRVLIVDDGADLSHEKINPFRSINLKESNGIPQIDDDQDSFIDNISGWNVFLKNANYFSPRQNNRMNEYPFEDIKELFHLNNEAVTAYDDELDLRWDRFEKHSLYKKFKLLINVSHGTHVAGIVAKTASSKDLALESYNFTDAEYELLFFPEIPQARAHFIRRYKNEFETLSRYIKNRKIQIVNISLGLDLGAAKEIYESAWRQHLRSQKLPKDTIKTPEEKLNYESAALEHFLDFEEGWKKVFTENPNTLFVVAAGNYNPRDYSNPPHTGNLNFDLSTPSNLGATEPNVITVAATDEHGLLADFSMYGDKQVSVAAPGISILSTVPKNLELRLSGTSQSTPRISGVAALILSKFPEITPPELKALFEVSGDTKGSLIGKTKTGQFLNQKKILIFAEQFSKSKNKNNLLKNFQLSSAHSKVDGTEGEVFHTPEKLKEFLRYDSQTEL